jgi:hypothetical protein
MHPLAETLVVARNFSSEGGHRGGQGEIGIWLYRRVQTGVQ